MGGGGEGGGYEIVEMEGLEPMSPILGGTGDSLGRKYKSPSDAPVFLVH